MFSHCDATESEALSKLCRFLPPSYAAFTPNRCCDESQQFCATVVRGWVGRGGGMGGLCNKHNRSHCVTSS